MMNENTTIPATQSTWRTFAGVFNPALRVFVLLSIVCGLLYPLLVTAIAQIVFPHEANGSLVEQKGKVVGSELIGQPFSDPRYLWGRPSATSPQPYNAVNSGGSNLGPTNPALADAVKSRIEALRAANPAQTGPVPQDLVTASASGLDPHISPEAAAYQIARIASVRGLPVEQVRAIIAKHTQGPDLGIFGETRVNVLQVNLELDALKP
jgi:potassium-transporting ATPase KdpC subunit